MHGACSFQLCAVRGLLARADTFTLVFMKGPRPQPSMVGKQGSVLSPLLHGAVAFMFELADAKQEYSEMLNCPTKDWPAEQARHCGPPSPASASTTREWAALPLQKASSCVLKRL